jgi:branched-chain amino acid transport system ATP-binding protein
MLLQVDRLSTGFGKQPVLRDVSLSLDGQEVVAFLGLNGAGKTVLLRCLSGLIPAWGGSITLDGEPLDDLPPWDRVKRGLAHAPQGRQIFPLMSVEEHLTLATECVHGDRAQRADAVAWTLDLFPRLKERLAQRAGDLSGGEQQMVAIARALVSRPQVLLLDEPSHGLAPRVVETVAEAIGTIARHTAILVVEQNLTIPRGIADRVIVLENGAVVSEGPAAEMLEREYIRRVYLGVEDAPAAQPGS